MKNLFALLLLACFHVSDSYAQFTLEHVLEGRLTRINDRWHEDFSKEEANDSRPMYWFWCYYPLGYFYSERVEGNTFTIYVYNENHELFTKKTYTFPIPSGYTEIFHCSMCYAIMEEPFFAITFYSKNTKTCRLCAYDENGKMIYDFGTGSLSLDVSCLYESQGKLCFHVIDSEKDKTYVYSVQSPSRLASPMLEYQPAVIVAPDRLTIFSARGKTDILNIYSLNGVVCDSKSLDTEGTTTYMTNALKPGTYIYEVGGESGKFVVK